MLWFWLIVFVVALITLIKASDFFNIAAEDIGLGYKISPFTIGLILLSIGTSLPELLSSIVAVWSDASEVVVGNVIGSNIANIFLVLGLSALIFKTPIVFDFKKIKLDMIFLIISTVFLLLSVLFYVFMWWEGLIGLFLFAIYMYLLKRASSGPRKVSDHKTKKKSFIIFPLSIVLLYVGARYTIDALIVISEILSIGREAIAAGAIAFATSLPELFVSLDAFKKGKHEMAAGNIIGSCIFNTFIVMGIPSLIGSLYVPAVAVNIYLPVMILAIAFLFFVSYKAIPINRWWGGAIFLLYMIFIVLIFAY